MLISKKLVFGIAFVVLAGLLTLGFQKGWIGKRATQSSSLKTNGPVNIELSDGDIAIAQKMTMIQGLPSFWHAQGRSQRHGQSPRSR